jgi:hypothetical protein
MVYNRSTVVCVHEYVGKQKEYYNIEITFNFYINI